MTETRTFDVLTIGGIDMDMVLTVPELPGADLKVIGQLVGSMPGGPAANFACAASWLGLRVAALAEVGEDQVRAARTFGGADPGQGREVGRVESEAVRAVAGSAKTIRGTRRFGGVDVESDQSSPGHQMREQRLGVAACAQRAIDREFAGTGPQMLDHLPHHDGEVHTAASHRRPGLIDPRA